MRRTTLGGLSPAQLNARGGAGGGGGAGRISGLGGKGRLLGGGSSHAAPGAGAGAVDNRLSAGSQRRSSSLYGAVSSKGPPVKSDPRPLTDKGYQQQCIRILLNFLASHGYDHALSPKLLMAPTSKEFLHIVQFLFRRIDGNMKYAGKVEDEVPVLFKRLGYPFQISKSALYSVGSLHTWPGLLAALTWVVELLSYEERAEQLRQDGVLLDEGGQLNVFNEYVGRAYEHFLAGEDESCALMDQQLEGRFQQQDQDLQLELDRLVQANVALQTELDALKLQPSPLAIVESKKADFISDIGKFNKLISSQQAHQQALEKKLEEKKQDLSSKQVEIAEVNEENEKLKARIAAQEINLADVDKMSKEKSKIKEILRGVLAQREGLDKTVWDSEVQLSKKLEELEATLRTYHTTGDRLKLIPLTAKRAEGIVYEVELNTRGAKPEEMLGADLKGTIKPGLQNLKDTYSRKTRELQQEALVLDERRCTCEELLTEQTEIKLGLELQYKKAELQLKQEKEKLEQDLRCAREETENVEATISTLHSSIAGTLPELEDQLQAALAEEEQVKLACTDESKVVMEEAMSVADLLIEHKTHIEDTLTRVGGNFSNAISCLKEPLALA